MVLPLEETDAQDNVSTYKRAGELYWLLSHYSLCTFMALYNLSSCLSRMEIPNIASILHTQSFLFQFF